MKFLTVLTMSCFVFMGNVMAENNRVDGLRPDAPELAKPGEHRIGVTTVDLIHKNQVDAAKLEAGKEAPMYDRPLTVEVWYPSSSDKSGGQYENVYLRDGETQVTLHGQAVRDAAPQKKAGGYPLVIISHGYPGNRFLLSHLAENLSSKGYVVAAIDHTDSTYHDKTAFHSTLINRAFDQKFVLDEMARLNASDGNLLNGIIDTSKTGLVGYSMGAYGSVITAGGGVTDAIANHKLAGPGGHLKQLIAGSDTHEALMDPRFKAIISVAPWGKHYGFWDDKSLAGVRVPMFFMAGSVDDVSGYDKGTKAIFQGVKNVDRYLLTFENANHNAAAPIPAPVESWTHSETLGYAPFGHYSDPVWDTLRMNNIMQHFATAYFGKFLKGQSEMQGYLDLVEVAKEGVHAAEKDGTFKPEHTYWKGFPKRSAVGLKLEHLTKQ